MRVSVVMVVVVVAACVSNPPPTPDPPDPDPPDGVATLHVTVEGSGEFDPQDVQLAIVWRRDYAVYPQRRLEPQELTRAQHSLAWPLTIEAVLPALPSDDPYWSSPQVGARPGRLVAFVDQNGNGRLDFTNVTATAFADRIIAYAAGTNIMHYSTVDVIAQQVHEPNVGLVERPIDTPIVLPQRSELQRSCHMLADWAPYSAYRNVFGGIALDPNDPSQGPWDLEAADDAPCPGNLLPALTQRISCDAPGYQFHALEVAMASPFIASTCGEVMRVCEGRRSDPNGTEPWPCPCDTTKYVCTPYEGGL